MSLLTQRVNTASMTYARLFLEGDVSKLREAMLRAAEVDDDNDVVRNIERIANAAVGKALTVPPKDDAEELAEQRREAAEVERQRREDALASFAMEIVDRTRSLNGRTKWSPTDGRVVRQIVEALRGLPSDE